MAKTIVPPPTSCKIGQVEPNSEITSWLDALVKQSGPITFLDAWTIVERSKTLSFLPARTIHSLLAVYDAPSTTQHAQRILGRYLSQQAALRAQERERATRPIERRESGSLSRAVVGESCHIALDERVALGWSWQLKKVEGPITVIPFKQSGAPDGRSHFEVHCAQVGVATLKIAEVLDPNAKTLGRKLGPRAFSMTFVIEETSSE